MRYLLIGITLLFAPYLFAVDYTVKTIPNPKQNGTSWVCNPDGIIAPQDVIAIENMINGLYQNTTDEICVVAVNSIGGEDHKEFANELFNYWGIGKRGKDNGLLLLVVLDDHKVRFEVGRGLEPIIPDLLAKEILDKDVVPLFKQNNYSEGIVSGITTAFKILNDPTNKAITDAYTASDSNSMTGYEADQAKEDYFIFTMIMLFITGVYLFIMYFVFKEKVKHKTFTHLHHLAVGEDKEEQPISVGRWIFLYIVLPALLCASIFIMEAMFDFFILLYIYFGFILIEKRLRENRYYLKKDIDPYKDHVALVKANDNWGWTLFFFPLPFVFYWIWYSYKKRSLRNTARHCIKCDSKMTRLDEKSDDNHLSKSQILEEQLKSVDYDVWLCKNCNHHEVLNYVNYWSKYESCPSCKVNAYYLHSDKTLVSPTYTSTGTGQKTYLCKSCKHKKESTYTIARLERSSSSSGGSSGGGSSSWGGGSSGGGGASSSW